LQVSESRGSEAGLVSASYLLPLVERLWRYHSIQNKIIIKGEDKNGKEESRNS
jgi:hypothetical protein